MSQTDALVSILQDRDWHSSYELVERIYNQTTPTIARLSARVYDAKQRGQEIESKMVKGVCHYRISPKQMTILSWR